MQHDPNVSLFDILFAADYIVSRTKDIDLDGYLSNLDLRFAVERNFITIGEAMANLRRRHPATSSRLEDESAVIQFRNFIVHQYWAIDSREVWRIAHRDVPALRQAVAALIEELPPRG